MAGKLLFAGTDRPLGLYIHGHHGTGKSSLITNLILQDINHGRGVCVIDCTRDLLKPIIARLPERRIKDTTYFSTYSHNPQAIDFLSPFNEQELEIILDDTSAIFDLDDAQRSQPILYQILAALLDANKTSKTNFGILDIATFIENPDRVLRKCSQRIQNDWVLRPKDSDYGTIIGRLRKFQTLPTLRRILTPNEDAISIPKIVKQNQIFLVDLRDTKSDFFLASMIVSKIRQAIWRRAGKLESQLTPYYLYIDEAHAILKFAAEDFETIMTRARKYKLCLTMTNQLPADLPSQIQAKLVMMGMSVHFKAKGKAFVLAGSEMEPIAYDLRTKKPKPTNLARYAEILQKLTVDKSTGHDTKNVVESKNASDGNKNDPDFLRKRPEKADS